MSLGPLDLTGGPFLSLYIALFVGTIIIAVVIPRLMRPEGRPQRVKGGDQLAYLAGGASRFADTVMVRMLTTGALMMTGKNAFAAVPQKAAATPAELSVADLPSPFRWRTAERALRAHVQPIERQLVADGLLMSHARARAIQLRVILPFLALLIFGIAKWIIGYMRDRPVGYLTVLLIVTLVCAIIFADIDRRTQAGHDALAEAKRQAKRLSIAPTSPEIALAVALFGTAVLAGSGWEAFHQLRSAGDSGGSAGSGDGGGDGGGCGGCGS